MSGPTAQQTELTNEEISAYQQAQQLTQEQYANQQAIYGPMVQQFQGILEGGPSQTGFSDAEDQNLKSQDIEGTAENYKGAAEALGSEEAAEGGGNSPLEGGAEQEQKEGLAESSAGEESKEESGIDEANYQQGRQNWVTAATGLQEIAAGENPLGYENAETGAGESANSEADAIASEQNSWKTAALGGAASIAGAGLEGYESR